jgi:hypothetical protein
LLINSNSNLLLLNVEVIKKGLGDMPSEKDYPKSFINERSAEYVLVPNLKSMLHEKFGIVTPLFPWLTREGGTLSKHIHEDGTFRMIGLYARRPKLVSTGTTITIKLNRQILMGAKQGEDLGIPIIAGCPLVKDFWELGGNPQCVWIRLDQDSNDDIEIEIANFSKSINHLSSLIFQRKADLLEFLTDRAGLMNLNEAMTNITTIKQASWGFERRGWLASVIGYKPVYFILK